MSGETVLCEKKGRYEYRTGGGKEPCDIRF